MYIEKSRVVMIVLFSCLILLSSCSILFYYKYEIDISNLTFPGTPIAIYPNSIEEQKSIVEQYFMEFEEPRDGERNINGNTALASSGICYETIETIVSIIENLVFYFQSYEERLKGNLSMDN